ncbi:MAG: hypothetical protein ACFCVD_07000 [Nodosilinea sp.]
MNNNVVLVVCGGLHPASYSGQILTILAQDHHLGQLRVLVFSPPPPPIAVLSAHALRRWLETALAPTQAATGTYPKLIFWAFSAGCVGATALVEYWRRYRGQVLALFLVDGWGVPGITGVPIHRLSHDRFTHATSAWLGAENLSFYAHPAVPHLQLWQQPQLARGWAIGPSGSKISRSNLSAAEFLTAQSRLYL